MCLSGVMGWVASHFLPAAVFLCFPSRIQGAFARNFVSFCYCLDDQSLPISLILYFHYVYRSHGAPGYFLLSRFCSRREGQRASMLGGLDGPESVCVHFTGSGFFQPMVHSWKAYDCWGVRRVFLAAQRAVLTRAGNGNKSDRPVRQPSE
ncbi:hypothetical protein EDB89DRAFT_1927494 [Lactarius sanguifluus]|nr:hypothetical protein EDB89DRAFT_1927494 [Lactarius sanguifluus]